MPVVPTTSPSMKDGDSFDSAGDGVGLSSSQLSPLVERERDRRFPVHRRMNTYAITGFYAGPCIPGDSATIQQ
eukprot:10674128-Lingulodinium_polyedra.AAC.1